MCISWKINNIANSAEKCVQCLFVGKDDGEYNGVGILEDDLFATASFDNVGLLLICAMEYL